MHVYWDEFTITWPGGSATGNAARDKVESDLGVAVEGNASTTPARVGWRGRPVTSELVAVAIRALITEQGKPWTLIYKPSRRIKRESEGLSKLDVVTAAQREEQNRTYTKPPIYAIVGCGAAAVVNHTTLRQTAWGRERVGDAEIVHIGFEDPWGHYNEHEMGQFPQLLGLPGYENRPNLTAEDPAAPRNSTAFAAATQHEWRRIEDWVRPSDRPLRVFRYCVALIQARGEAVSDSVKGNLVQEGLDIEDLEYMLAMNHLWKRGRYRLLLVDPEGNLDWAYADKVDICTGAGKARTIDESMATPEVRTATYTKIWEPPESWDPVRCNRSIMSGTEALYRETQWPEGKRVCIMGSGGVGVNMIERARDTGCFADWLATQTLHASFVIGRNDILLKHPRNGPKAGAAMEMDDFEGRNDQLAPIDPRDPKWRFGQGTDIGSVELVGDVDARQVQVKFVSSRRTYENTPNAPDMKGKPIPPMIRDHREVEKTLAHDAFAYSPLTEQQLGADYAPNVYDRVIRAAGQDIRDVGQSEQLAMQLDLRPIVNGADDRMVGLETADGTVRILGAAATGNPQLVEPDDAAAERMRQYHASLPAQGQIIFVGFVFSALNVATANHYFDEVPNCNVNTASEKELKALWDEQRAKRTVALRKTTQCGFLWHCREALLLSYPGWVPAMKVMFPDLETIVRSKSAELFAPRLDPPRGYVEWNEMLQIQGLPPALAHKVIRAYVRGCEATMPKLQEAIALHEEADALEYAAFEEHRLLAHGWEKLLWTPRTIAEFNELEEEAIAAKTERRFAAWVVEARAANAGPWASMEGLQEDIGRRFRLKLDRRNDLEPLPSDWKDQLAAAALNLGDVKTKYRPADPLLFPARD